MKQLLLALMLAIVPLVSTLAETYEQAFVTCSQQVAAQDGDHKAAIDACMRARGFTPETDESATGQ